MAKKKRRPDRSKGRPKLSPKLAAALSEVHDLMSRRRWAEATELLDELQRKHPKNQLILEAALAAASQRGDSRRQLSLTAQLLPFRPNDPTLHLALALAYFRNDRPALAFRAFRDFLERWPDHPEAARVRETLKSAEPDFRQYLASIGLSDESDLHLGVLHDQIREALETGKPAEARRAAEELLKERPNFVPALNNMGEAFFHEAKFDDAIATARRVLAIDPANAHALANLPRYLLLSGKTAEAREAANELLRHRPVTTDGWVKRMEALACLGDDAGVLEAYAEATTGAEPSRQDRAFLEHLVAVAHYRQGREVEAREHWEASLLALPGFGLAKENLEDMRKPIEERNAGWPASFGAWVPRPLFDDLSSRVMAVPRSARAEVLMRVFRRYVEEWPVIDALVPILLDRGDPGAREWALRMAVMAETPNLAAALRDFALGQRGPDRMRLDAAVAASKAGLMPPGPMRFWSRGRWAETILMAYELTDEPTGKYKHSPEVNELATEAHEAMNVDFDGERAEALLKQALALEPDMPDLLNNLATAYLMQGRQEEGLALTRQIHERFPDYWFGIVGAARILVDEGKFKEAHAKLKPLLSQRKMHLSEFAALAQVHVYLLMAEGETEGAKMWLGMWEQTTPEHPQLTYWRQRIREAEHPERRRRGERGRRGDLE